MSGEDHSAVEPAEGKRRSWWALAPLAVFLALSLLFGWQLLSGRDASQLPSVLIGKPAPQFTLPPLAGLAREGAPVPGLSGSDLTGKPHLVNIFASWCAPCRAEHPVLMGLSKEKRIEVVGINYKDKAENALRFLGTLGNPYTRVGVDERGRAAIDWGFYGIPETLLVDGSGIVRHKIVGPITAQKLAELEDKIDSLFGS